MKAIDSETDAKAGTGLNTCVYILALAQIVCLSARAQDSEVGRRIYADCAKSVFVLYAQSASGEFVAQGSGFWVTGNKIVTNAHVASAGKIFVDLGSARVPAKLQGTDTYNDLAILTVDIDITAEPLVLSPSKPSPGDRIFAIGNPQGLDRTISEGVVSATREMDRRELIQVTAPISHGSSGGPIVNIKGQVVGVAVGFLESGQSLNFAVPASKVAALLKGEQPKPDLDVFDQIDSLKKLQQDNPYSADPDSPWQKASAQMLSLLERALSTAGNNDAVLLRIAQIADENWYQDIAVEAGEKLVAAKESPQAHTMLAKALSVKSELESDDTKKHQLMLRAEREARLGIAGRAPTAESYFWLANVLEDRALYKEAQSQFSIALNAAKRSGDLTWADPSSRGLIRCADALQEFDEAQKLLESLTRSGEANSYDWSSHAERLANAQQYEQAANSFLAAAELKGSYSNWCSAATYFNLAGEKDSALLQARKCISEGTGVKDSEDSLGTAHRQIADILNSRGVYTEGLNHAKEAAVLVPNDPFPQDSMADALIGLRRFEEAVTAEQQAIRLSDGKYGWMHFTLGQAYFALQNWDFALQSYEKAAELDPKDAAAAYNAAAANHNLHRWSEAVNWYREYLKRSPEAADKQEVLEKIRILSQ